MHVPDMTSALKKVLGVNVGKAMSQASDSNSQRVNDALARYMANLDAPMEASPPQVPMYQPAAVQHA
jgi:hypothetical protein